MASPQNTNNRAALYFARVGVILFLFVSLLGAALDYWVVALFERSFPLALFLPVVGFPVAFALLFTQYARVNRQIRATAEIKNIGAAANREYLICGVSPISVPGKFDALDLSVIETDPQKIASSQNKEPYYSWQQNIRVIHALPGVKKIFIIQPNHDQLEKFRDMIEKVFPDRFDREDIQIVNGLETRLLTENSNTLSQMSFAHGEWFDMDYENYNYVTAAINWVFEDLRTRFGRSENAMQSEVVIDVTAGLKIFSIAAAVASLNRDIIFVYASSNPKEHCRNKGVKVFNASIELFGRGLTL